jgi:hypothetical protein
MSTDACLFCHRTSDAVPVLIHDPEQLVGVLPGAEELEPSQHQD